MTEGRREPPSASTSSQRADQEEHDGPPRRDGTPQHEDPRERVGPLLVERYRKADGRSLILYREAAASG